ncbi:uncharacterized protein GIQ15_03576 [Arthroderma uncinatum]|uniref:uncharacterized protein n=1 Tax=Arthroderma uncinatum TaxID=74035 RepID=UPI00144AE3E6|nr:uncharacterized protein GIQ15_03576 [Arthroderma uncinatum]KAF3484252.1 hypothetical protein GIQ15_03576 [Arthroderma uncinatum]
MRIKIIVLRRKRKNDRSSVPVFVPERLWRMRCEYTVYLQLGEAVGKPTGDGGGGGGCSKSFPPEMYLGWAEEDCMARWMSTLSVETESCFVFELLELELVLEKECMV